MEEVFIKSFIFEYFDLDYIVFVLLFFQFGYLMVKLVNLLMGEYVLYYFNKEVCESMYVFLLQEFFFELICYNIDCMVYDLQQVFVQDNLEQVWDILDSVLVDLFYEIFDKMFEGLFYGLVYILFNYLGLYCKSEVYFVCGQVDVVVQMLQAVYIFEFKIY